MYEYPIPERHGTIKNFGGLSPVALLRMRDDLKLSLRADSLRKCAEYYRDNRMSDPNVQTVCFLDSYITEFQTDYRQKAIAGLTTDSKLIADTFSDLIDKRNELYPKSSPEIRLVSLNLIGTDWLNRALGQVNPLPDGCSFHASPASRLTETAHGLEAVGKSSYGSHSAAVYRRFRTNRKTAGESLMIVCPSESVSAGDFEAAFADMLKNQNISNIISDMRPIRCGGIASALLSMSDGAAVNLCGLPARSDNSHLCTDLCTMYDGCMLITCRHGFETQLKEAFSKRGIFCSCFGAVTQTGVLSIAEGTRLVMALPYNMLIALAEEQLIQAEIPEEPGNFIPAEILSAGICPQSGLTSVNSQNSRDVQPDGFISSAVADISESPFHSAYYAVAAAYLRAVAAGCDVNSAFLAITADSPCEPCGIYDNGKAVAAMLGCYRAQMDLCVRMTDYDTSRQGGERLCLAAQIYTKKPEYTVKNSFTKAGSRVYLLAPRQDENGLPELREIRGLAKYVHDLCTQKRILSAKVVGGVSLRDALNSMNGAFTLADGTDIPDEAIRLGIIIETDSEADADFLGLTGPSRQNGGGILRGEFKSKVWNSKPNVLIPVLNQPSPALRELFTLITSAGCVCNVIKYESTPEGLGKLSADMLKSEITVFTQSHETTALILSDARVAFAVEEYKRTGKLILAVGHAVAALSEAQLLPKVTEPARITGSRQNAGWKLNSAATPWLACCPEEMRMNLSDTALLIRDGIGTDADATLEINGIRYISLFADSSGLVAGAPAGCFAEMFLSAVRYFS